MHRRGDEYRCTLQYCKQSGNAIHVLKNKNYLMGITTFLVSASLCVLTAVLKWEKMIVDYEDQDHTIVGECDLSF